MYKVGSNIDSWCTKCRLVLAHTIEATHGDKIERVSCNTCGGKHKFRSKEVSKESSKTAKAKAVKEKKKPKTSAIFALESVNENQLSSYSIRNCYNSGDYFLHPSFGPGMVMGTKDSYKIEVLFKAGQKTLVHNK